MSGAINVFAIELSKGLRVHYKQVNLWQTVKMVTHAALTI